MQEIDSGFSSLSFSSTMSRGVPQKSNLSPLSPVSSTLDSTFQNAFCPSSPMSPVIRHGNKSQFSQQSSYDYGQGSAQRNSVASPIINSGRNFSPVIGTHTPRSVDGRSFQFSSGNNQLDPLSTFLPPPPNLDGTDIAKGSIDRSDNPGFFLTGDGNALQPSMGSQGLGLGSDQEPRSPFVSTPTKHANTFNGGNSNRDRSFSSPGPNYQLPLGMKSPSQSSSNQILYEDRPSSWNEGSGFPAPSIYRADAALSPGSYNDRYNSSRPPRHGGTKGPSDMQGLNSPTKYGRQSISDGNFNFPSPMSNAPPGHMNPIGNNNNHMRSQSHGAGIGSPSFDSSAQGGHFSNRNSFGSGGVDSL